MVPNIIPWHDLLQLLEGHEVHLPEPKRHYRCDFSFKGDTPIFCTAKDVSFVRPRVVEERETEMISVRWPVFAFSLQISEAEKLQVPPCPRCFAEPVLTLFLFEVTRECAPSTDHHTFNFRIGFLEKKHDFMVQVLSSFNV